MATFIPQIQGNIPDLELYTPNFELMENWLSVKQERYNQGRMATSQAYAAIKNLPLTDEANIAKKEQFIKDAQSQIKRLASVDLSLEENVVAAREIFNPLLEDENIMTDATFTSKARALMQVNANFKNSSDKEDRARWNPNNDTYAALKLQEFKMADSETRKQMAAGNMSFVSNVNLFDRYLKIAKDNGFDIKRTSSPSDAAGNLLPFMVVETNGKEITPLAYNRLARAFNADPEVQAYYQQQGYIKVQSELQELIPQMGYQAAVAQVTQIYQAAQNPKEKEEKKSKLQEANAVNDAKKKVYESKATKVGVIPGSKEHMEYLKITAEEAGFDQEYSAVVDEAKNLNLLIEDMNSLYQVAGQTLYQNDLNAAATDYAMSDYSIDYKATPNYGDWIEARGGGDTQSPKAPVSGLLPGDDTAPITYLTDDDTDKGVIKTNNDLLTSKQNKLNEGLVNLIGLYTQRYNKLYPDEMTTEKIPNTGIRDVTSAGAWWERTSESDLAGQETQRVIDYFSKLDKEGVLDAQYPEVKRAYDKWKNNQEAYLKLETRAAESYSTSVKNVEAEIALNPNEEMASLSVLIPYMYDQQTGIKSKEVFEKNVLDAYNRGELSQTIASEVLNLSNTPIRPSFIDILNASYELAEKDFMDNLSADQRRVEVTNERGDVIGYQTAWEGLSDKERQEFTKPYIKEAQENPQSIVGLIARENLKPKRRLGKFYDEAYSMIEDFYQRDPSSKSVLGMLNPMAIEMNGAVDALELVSSNIDVAPNAALPNNTARAEQAEMLSVLNRYIQSGDITISSGGFENDKVDAFTRGKISGENNQERVSYKIFSRFYEDMKTKNNAKTSTSTTDPRATFKVLPGVDFGDGRLGAIVEINFNTGWLQGVSSTADDPGFKFAVDNQNKQATLFIPEDIAGMMNLPMSEDVESYSSLVMNGTERINVNGNFATLEYNADNNTISYSSVQQEFNPKTGKYRTVTYESPSTMVANAVNYRYLNANLYNELSIYQANQEEAERLYNEENGAVYNTDELKQ